MLLNNFFTINTLETVDSAIKTSLVINTDHAIFEGHFPEQPVVPGVCMMQMVKEIMEEVLKKKTNLVKAMEMKFLAVINPIQNNVIEGSLHYSIDANNNIMVSASLFKGELTHFKFKGVFTFQ